MKLPTLLLAALLAALGTACSETPAQRPDAANPAQLILTNGRVYSLSWNEPLPDGSASSNAPHDANGWQPDAHAIAVRDGDIVYVGSDSGALGFKGPATRVIDLDGATVLPGLIDSHTHIPELGALLERVNLVGVDSQQEAVLRVATRAQQTPPGDWIIGAGWDEGAWADSYPDKSLLSHAVPDHPVFLRGLHGFGGWVNERALEELGITAATAAPTGGEIRLGADGQPNGLFLNRALELLDSRVPEPSRQVQTSHILKGLQQMAQDGFVAVQDAGLGHQAMSIFEELEAADRLPIRVYAMLSLRDEQLIRQWLSKGPDQDNDSMLVTRSVKAYYDGALGSRGARLLADYSDQPGHRGISGAGYGFNQDLNAEAMKAGFQIAIHAIGDAGNREALDILQRVFQEAPMTAANRHRIEHAQVLAPRDLPRLARLGVIASMEPPHAVEDKTWAQARLGPQRILGAYAWRSLREANTHLTLNSDNPGSDHSIFYGLHAAIARQDKQLQPPGGWYPEQALSIEEAIRGYTSWSAYASFRDHATGKLEAGRWADITVMDIDPFALAEAQPEAILKGRILLTVVNGQIVYERL